MIACVLGAAPFLRGGIERLTWDVYFALQESLGVENVSLAALVGAQEGGQVTSSVNLAYSGSPRLTPLSKVRFARHVALGLWGGKHPSFLLSMHVNQAQVAQAARFIRGSRYAVWAHGAEVWSSMLPLPRAALRAADVVLCSSDYTRSRVINGQGVSTSRVVRVYPAVHGACLRRSERMSRSARDAPPVILSVGRVAAGYEYKGFDSTIRALPGILQKVPDARYVIVGGGDGIAYLKRLARRLGVAGRVEFRGDVSDAQLWDAFEEARVFCLPSRVHLGRKPQGEGLGIVYLEAAAFARPVIAGGTGGAGEALVDGITGRTVDPMNVSALTDALLKYLRNSDDAEAAGAAGRARILAEFTPKAFEQRLVGLLRERRLIPAGAGAQ